MYIRIKDMRIDNDLVQQDIADVLRVSRSTYANYERGARQISAQVLNSLADYYGTSVDYLLYRTDEKEPYPKSKKRKLLEKLK